MTKNYKEIADKENEFTFVRNREPKNYLMNHAHNQQYEICSGKFYVADSIVIDLDV